jgi:hypothetical protein
MLARKWGCAPEKIIGFIRRGELRAINLAATASGRPRYAIDERDIEAFEVAREVVADRGVRATRRDRSHTARDVKEFF